MGLDVPFQGGIYLPWASMFAPGEPGLGHKPCNLEPRKEKPQEKGTLDGSGIWCIGSIFLDNPFPPLNVTHPLLPYSTAGSGWGNAVWAPCPLCCNKLRLLDLDWGRGQRKGRIPRRRASRPFPPCTRRFPSPKGPDFRNMQCEGRGTAKTSVTELQRYACATPP